MKRIDLSGKKFGHLTAVSMSSTGPKGTRWLCVCDCGNSREVHYSNLVRSSGGTTSCGCRRYESKIKHGGSGTKLYRKWKELRRRCNNENRDDYERYGGRGIKVCDDWNEFEPFRDWAFSNGYEEGLTIDRIDFNGDYCPENCRWATIEEQNNNTRQNVFVVINGVKKTITQWAKEYSLPTSTVYERYRNGIRGEELFQPKRVSMTGQHHTDETKAKISSKLKGKLNHNYGKTFSKETRMKMSESAKGRTAYNKINVTKEKELEIIQLFNSTNSISKVSRITGYDRKVIKRIVAPSLI